MIYIISVEPGQETARYLERIGAAYKYVACECCRGRFPEDKTEFYPCIKQHGSARARRAALELKGSVVLDDDYTSIQFGGAADSGIKAGRYKTAEELEMVFDEAKDIEALDDRLILGGYSGGALHNISSRYSVNIMQIFFGGKINRFFRDESDLYRLNDDVCACIMAKRRGYITIGLWHMLRTCQTPEGVDNTNSYDNRSWAKAFLPILYVPTHAKVVWCQEKKLVNGKTRPGRWHHLIDWAGITPKIIDKQELTPKEEG